MNTIDPPPWSTFVGRPQATIDSVLRSRLAASPDSRLPALGGSVSMTASTWLGRRQRRREGEHVIRVRPAGPSACDPLCRGGGPPSLTSDLTQRPGFT
jgi:hypothetical protein